MANLEQTELRGDAALAKMNDPLRTKTVEIRKLLGESATESSRARYRVGAYIAEIDDDAKTYGRGAVRRVARAVGRDVSTLYDYALVARTWDRKEFDALAARKGDARVPLSFSHFIELARIETRRTRAALLEHAYRDSLTVRELSVLVASKIDGGAASEADVPARLHQVVRAANGILDRARDWRASVSQIASEKSTPELASLLESAAERQRAVAEAYLGYADLLETQHRRVVRDLGGKHEARQKKGQ